MQRNYWVVRLGRGNEYAKACHQQGIIAVGWSELDLDLTPFAKLDQRAFTEAIASKLAEVISGKTEKSISGAARQLYKFAALIKPGDIVMSPANSEGLKYFGIVRGEYRYEPGNSELPYRHRRNIDWVAEADKSVFSEELRNSSGAIMTVFNISKYGEEIESLLSGKTREVAGQEVEDIKDFGLETHLEDFLIENWDRLPLGDQYQLHEEDGEIVGQQYVTDVGRIDILAKSRDGKQWFVIELKKGRSSDAVVGQLLRYMGYISKHLAASDEKVSGLIIAGVDDENIRYAISNLPNVRFMTYAVDFTLKE